MYAVGTKAISLTDASKLTAIDGSAMFTMLPSRLKRKEPITTVNTISELVNEDGTHRPRD
jgi:hypothetical protein